MDEDNNPIALVKDPNVDLEKKKITFLGVNSGVLLGTSKSYEFQNWKLACGGTQLYSAASGGTVHEYSYSPLTCKIVGNRKNGDHIPRLLKAMTIVLKWLKVFEMMNPAGKPPLEIWNGVGKLLSRT